MIRLPHAACVRALQCRTNMSAVACSTRKHVALEAFGRCAWLPIGCTQLPIRSCCRRRGVNPRLRICYVQLAAGCRSTALTCDRELQTAKSESGSRVMEAIPVVDEMHGNTSICTLHSFDEGPYTIICCGTYLMTCHL